MSTNESEPKQDVVVAKIAEAFESQVISPRPSDEETSLWLKQHIEQDSAPVRPILKRRVVMRFVAPLAAAAAGIALVVFYGAGSTTFAQMIQHIAQHQTVTFSVDVEQPGKPRLKGQAFAKRPQLLRIDWIVNGQSNVNITNYQKGELISYDNSSDVTIYGLPSAGGFDVVRQLEKVDVRQTKQLPDAKNKIENTHLVEFEEGPITGRLWVDRQTKLPVRIEASTPGELGGGQVVYSNFDWGAEVKNALFQVPAGRKVVRDNLLATPTEEELIAAFQIRQAFSSEPYAADFLKNHAGLAIGRLAYDHQLSRAANFQRQSKTLKPYLATIGLTEVAARDPEVMQKRIDYLCMKVDQWEHPVEEYGNWVGEGVTPGEDKPLCWWKFPGKGIRMLYADLKIRDAQVAP